MKRVQQGLFNHTMGEVDNLGCGEFQRGILFNSGLLSFDSKEKNELDELEFTELMFLHSLYFDSGLPKEIILSMLSSLEKPYTYSLEDMYWDFKEKKWKDFPVFEEPEIEELIEKLEDDEDYEKLEELKELIEFKIKNSKKQNSKKRICPKCKSENVLRILYGLPDETTPSNVYLGGCCVTDEDPDWHCDSCSWEWGHNSEGCYNKEEL